MKIRVNFKSPDALDCALEDFPREVHSEIREDLATWIKWDEYIEIEFDTDEKTATVLPAS